MASERPLQSWESSKRESREAEDDYLAAAGASIFSEESRRQRRALVLSSVLTFAVCALNLRPKSIPALGLDLDGAKQLVTVAGFGIVTLYFWTEFLVYGARDFRVWSRRVRVTHRRLARALPLEEGNTRAVLSGHGALETRLADVQRRRGEYENEASQGKIDSRLGPYLGVGPTAWVEYRLPHAISALAITSWAVALWHLLRAP